MEGVWEDVIKDCYKIDNGIKHKGNERFYYNPDGYPLKDSNKEQEYQKSFLKKVEDELVRREFNASGGTRNKNIWDFMSAICQYSYILSYSFLPQKYNPDNVTVENWQSLGTISLPDLSVAVLADAVDSIARVWFRVWRRYETWVRDREKEKKEPGKEIKQP